MTACSLTEFIWIWDRLQNLSLPGHHRMMARFLEGLVRRKESGLLMAFRNSGKSTIVGLFGAWLLLQNPEIRLMILSADHGLAKKMVHHMKQILERHPLTQHLIPENRDEWASDRFTVRRRSGQRDPSVLARGLMANMTGCRADVIICDDVEVPKTCDTAGKREALRQKLSELDYILTPDGIVLYVGTPHTYDTIYRETTGGFLMGWPVLRIPLVLADGTSAWPERFGIKHIEALKQRSGPNKFASQMMLRPVPLAESRLDADRLRFYSGELNYREANGRAVLNLNENRLTGVSCWWDPSFGSPGGDKSVVACVFTDERGQSYIHDIRYLTVPPDREATDWQCRAVCDFIQSYYIPAIHLETNGIGKFLPALLRQALGRAGLSCSVIEETSRRNKVERILSAWDAPLMNGSLWCHERIRKTPLIEEIRDFMPNGTAHDDGLDAVAGCLLAEPIRWGYRSFGQKQKTLEWRF